LKIEIKTAIAATIRAKAEIKLPIRAACALRLAESVASRAIFAERGF
jgi:hypothetical protein